MLKSTILHVYIITAVSVYLFLFITSSVTSIKVQKETITCQQSKTLTRETMHRLVY